MEAPCTVSPRSDNIFSLDVARKKKAAMAQPLQRGDFARVIVSKEIPTVGSGAYPRPPAVGTVVQVFSVNDGKRFGFTGRVLVVLANSEPNRSWMDAVLAEGGGGTVQCWTLHEDWLQRTAASSEPTRRETRGVAARPAEYSRYDTFEFIRGSREQLQAFGLEVTAKAGVRKPLTVSDGRGFKAEISRKRRAGLDDRDVFFARIEYAHLPCEPQACGDFDAAGGGLLVRRFLEGEHYLGAASDLIAAGIVRADQLPGAPGRAKTRMRYRGLTHHPYGCESLSIELLGGQWKEKYFAGEPEAAFGVSVYASPEETARRWDQFEAEKAQWKAAIRALGRPAPLAFAGDPSDVFVEDKANDIWPQDLGSAAIAFTQ